MVSPASGGTSTNLTRREVPRRRLPRALSPATARRFGSRRRPVSLTHGACFTGAVLVRSGGDAGHLPQFMVLYALH